MKTFHSTLIAPLAFAMLATGCSTMQSLQKPAEPAAAAAPAPEPAAPTMVRRKQASGLDAAQVGDIVATKNTSKIRSGLVNKTVTVELTKSADGKSYEATGVDNATFACKRSESGFDGGEVTAKVQAYRYLSKPKLASFDLDNCSSNFALSTEPAAKSAPVAAAAPAAAATTAAAKPAAASTGPKPGMDAQGNVIDSSKVESGSGRTVKGINDYEGEITGNPARNSKFTSLQIGMSLKQVTDITGQPTDSGAYVTGKAWIPFYFGGDRTRMELTYKGQGRLIFAGGSMGNMSGGNLIWIIHNPNESGYR